MPDHKTRGLLAAVRTAATAGDRLAASWEVWRHCETHVAAMASRQGWLAPGGVTVDDFRVAVKDRALDQLVVKGGFARVRTAAAFWGFVQTTVRNAAISELRQRMSRPRRTALGPPAQAEEDGDEASYRLEPRAAGTPESELRVAARTEILLAVADEVAAAHWRWVRAIRLRFNMDFTFQQIGIEMNVTERTAQRYVKNGLGAFRDRLRQRRIALNDL